MNNDINKKVRERFYCNNESNKQSGTILMARVNIGQDASQMMRNLSGGYAP